MDALKSASLSIHDASIFQTIQSQKTDNCLRLNNFYSLSDNFAMLDEILGHVCLRRCSDLEYLHKIPIKVMARD
jgi:hypothetical protein